MKKFEVKFEQWKKWIVNTFSLFFIILFTYAATSKLLIFESFHLQLEQSPFIGKFSLPAAIILPGILLIISFLFFISKFNLLAFYCSFILLIIFNLYIIAVLLFAESIPCSCAGLFSSWSWHEQLYFNIGVMLLAMVGIALSYRLRKSKEESTAIEFNIKS